MKKWRKYKTEESESRPEVEEIDDRREAEKGNIRKSEKKKMRGRGDGKMTDEDAEDNIHRIL